MCVLEPHIQLLIELPIGLPIGLLIGLPIGVPIELPTGFPYGPRIGPGPGILDCWASRLGSFGLGRKAQAGTTRGR